MQRKQQVKDSILSVLGTLLLVAGLGSVLLGAGTDDARSDYNYHGYYDEANKCASEKTTEAMQFGGMGAAFLGVLALKLRSKDSERS